MKNNPFKIVITIIIILIVFALMSYSPDAFNLLCIMSIIGYIGYHCNTNSKELEELKKRLEEIKENNKHN